MPNQYLGVLLHTMAISGLSRVRTLNCSYSHPLRHIQYRLTATGVPSPVSRSCALVASSDENICCAIGDRCAP
jgi:hypothetical protein